MNLQNFRISTVFGIKGISATGWERAQARKGSPQVNEDEGLDGKEFWGVRGRAGRGARLLKAEAQYQQAEGAPSFSFLIWAAPLTRAEGQK